jgi:hypothetical protein
MTAPDQFPGPSGRTYSCNLDHTATPGGLKVRWKTRIATGREAQRLDILQQRAIIDLLTWAGKHQDQHQRGPGKQSSPAGITSE